MRPDTVEAAQARLMRCEVEEAVVVGAGAAGLAAAAMLKRRGIDPLVVNRDSGPGAAWRRRYDGLRINTVRWMSDLPGYRMDRRYGRWPTAEEWADYLERYAEHYELRIEDGVEVARVDRRGAGWALTTSRGEIRAPIVVVATGLDREPTIPDWPGREGFAGLLVHSSEFRTAAPFRGKRVLVVGSGNSAFEIATLLHRGGAQDVRVAIRRAPIIFLREYFGVPLTVLSALARGLPDRLLDLAGRALPRWTFGDLSAFGLPEPRRRLSDMRRENYVPPIDSGFIEHVRAGDIGIVAAVERLDGAEVVHVDGRRTPAEAVIAATGYRTGLTPIVGHLGVLRSADEIPLRDGAPIARAPGLFFIGYHLVLTAVLPHLSTDARAIARAAARTRRRAKAGHLQ